MKILLLLMMMIIVVDDGVVVVVVEDDCDDDGHLLVPGRACPLTSSSASPGARLQERAPAYSAFDQDHIYHNHLTCWRQGYLQIPFQ